MIKKYWKWITGAIVIISCTVIFCIVMDKSTIRIYPDKLDAIDIDIVNLDQLVTIKNGTVLNWELVDNQQNKVNTIMVGKQYQLEFNVKTILGSEKIRVPITFADYTAPNVNTSHDAIEVEYDQVPNWETLIEVSDNYDIKVVLTMNADSFDAKLVDQVQLVKGSATDSSGNSSAININVKVLPPKCASDAYFDGTNCVCNKGYQGDGWVACVLKAPTTNKPKPQVNIPESLPNDDKVTSQVPQTPINDEPSVNEEQDTAFPSWGFEINDNSHIQANDGGSRCDAAGNAGQGRPDNAAGWACLFKDNQYYLTYFDSNDQIISQIGGF